MNFPGGYDINVKGEVEIDNCEWTSPNGNQYITKSKLVQASEILCPIPTFSLLVEVDKTAFGDWSLGIHNSVTDRRSNEKVTFIFFEHPTILSFSPTFGPAFGGSPIEIVANRFDLGGKVKISDINIQFKIGTSISEALCQRISIDKIYCIPPSYPEKKVKLSISFNGYQYIDVGEYDVQSCSPGFTSKNYESRCLPCKIGTFKSVYGFFECVPCAKNTYQDKIGQSQCTFCPLNTISNLNSKNITDCDCNSGYYRDSAVSGVLCKTCIVGGNCNGGASKPTPKSGYFWNSVNTQPKFFDKCLNADYCTGNITKNGGCQDTRGGLLCEQCAFGYYKSNNACLICNQDVTARISLIFVGLALLCLLFFRFAQLKVQYLSSISISISYFQIIAIFSTYKFKWPEEFKLVLENLKFLNFDLDIFVPECTDFITYGTKWGLTVSLPVIFAFLLVLGFIFELVRSLLAKIWGKLVFKIFSRLYKVNEQNWITKQFTQSIVSTIDFFSKPKSLNELKAFGDKCIHTFVIILSFIYVFVVSKAAQIFKCVEIKNASGVGSTMKMYSELTTTCYQGTWWIYFPFAVTIILVFGIGVILLFGYIFLFRKRTLVDRTFNARFRFFFVRFRNDKLYWQSIIILRKLMISVAVIFIPDNSMFLILYSSIVIFIAFIFQIHNAPFRRK
jgi:hypothetical protein